jgi:hypothetical protein
MDNIVDRSNPIIYRIDMDISNNVMNVYFDDPPREMMVGGQMVSNDEEYVVHYVWDGDVPHIYRLEFYNLNKFSVLQDWIEDAVEAAVGESFADSHSKGQGDRSWVE